jgi:hypothetical protein
MTYRDRLTTDPPRGVSRSTGGDITQGVKRSAPATGSGTSLATFREHLAPFSEHLAPFREHLAQFREQSKAPPDRRHYFIRQHKMWRQRFGRSFNCSLNCATCTLNGAKDVPELDAGALRFTPCVTYPVLKDMPLGLLCGLLKINQAQGRKEDPKGWSTALITRLGSVPGWRNGPPWPFLVTFVVTATENNMSLATHFN